MYLLDKARERIHRLVKAGDRIVMPKEVEEEKPAVAKPKAGLLAAIER